MTADELILSLFVSFVIAVFTSWLPWLMLLVVINGMPYIDMSWEPSWTGTTLVEWGIILALFIKNN